MHPARLFIVCGLPGTGKTTRAIELCERFGAIRLGADDWLERLGIDLWNADARERLESSQADIAIRALTVGTSVVVECGTWARGERDDLRGRAIGAGGLVHLELLDAPVDELWERVRARGREQALGTRAITRDDLTAWSDQIERPTPEELATYDPWPPVRAGAQPGSPAYPYGSWQPQSRPR